MTPSPPAGATGTLMGLCLSANCAAEVPVFFWSGRILERLGVERALHVAMGCYVLRLCCYLVGGCLGGRAGRGRRRLGNSGRVGGA